MLLVGYVVLGLLAALYTSDLVVSGYVEPFRELYEKNRKQRDDALEWVNDPHSVCNLHELRTRASTWDNCDDARRKINSNLMWDSYVQLLKQKRWCLFGFCMYESPTVFQTAGALVLAGASVIGLGTFLLLLYLVRDVSRSFITDYTLPMQNPIVKGAVRRAQQHMCKQD